PRTFPLCHRLITARRKHRNPYHEALEVWVGYLCHDVVFDFGSPPKADASGRVEQQQQAHLRRIGVEGCAQRLEAIRQRLDGNLAAGGTACCKKGKGSRGEKTREPPPAYAEDDTPSPVHSFSPVWSAATPPEKFRYRTLTNPAFRIRAASASWSGNFTTDSARYR